MFDHTMLLLAALLCALRTTHLMRARQHKYATKLSIALEIPVKRLAVVTRTCAHRNDRTRLANDLVRFHFRSARSL